MITLNKIKSLKGEVKVPGDKSISHRAIMIGSIAKGKTEITNFLQGADCLSTISCLRQMGINIENNTNNVLVKGNGLHGLIPPSSCLYVGNSGTTIRLISGILSAQNFEVTITGDESIEKRPMSRVIYPLTQMGAIINSKDGYAPLNIKGQKLNAIHYNSLVASAQVKSAILLGGLYADGITRVTEPFLSRNHTELMLKQFGANITSENTTASIENANELFGQKINVPGDISSCAYFLVAALICPNSEILIKNVGINPTRDGILRVCKQMGGNITLLNIDNTGEPTADILVKSSNLKGITIEGDIIPTLIDELPIISVLASFASGTTIIKDAAELKVKESNRIEVCTNNLKNMGVDVTSTEDGMIINGGNILCGTTIDSKLDHRIAMSFAVAALVAEGETTILGSECVDISYPNFYGDLKMLAR